MNLTDKIKYEIKNRDIRKNKFAEYLGVTPQRLNNWFARGNLPVEFVPKIAEYLGVTTDYLMNNDKMIVNSNIIHNSPHSTITATEAMSAFPPEVGAVIKFMLKHSEDKRLKIMQCIMVKCGEEE